MSRASGRLTGRSSRTSSRTQSRQGTIHAENPELLDKLLKEENTPPEHLQSKNKNKNNNGANKTPSRAESVEESTSKTSLVVGENGNGTVKAPPSVTPRKVADKVKFAPELGPAEDSGTDFPKEGSASVSGKNNSDAVTGGDVSGATSTSAKEKDADSGHYEGNDYVLAGTGGDPHAQDSGKPPIENSGTTEPVNDDKSDLYKAVNNNIPDISKDSENNSVYDDQNPPALDNKREGTFTETTPAPKTDKDPGSPDKTSNPADTYRKPADEEAAAETLKSDSKEEEEGDSNTPVNPDQSEIAATGDSGVSKNDNSEEHDHSVAGNDQITRSNSELDRQTLKSTNSFNSEIARLHSPSRKSLNVEFSEQDQHQSNNGDENTISGPQNSGPTYSAVSPRQSKSSLGAVNNNANNNSSNNNKDSARNSQSLSEELKLKINLDDPSQHRSTASYSSQRLKSQGDLAKRTASVRSEIVPTDSQQDPIQENHQEETPLDSLEIEKDSLDLAEEQAKLSNENDDADRKQIKEQGVNGEFSSNKAPDTGEREHFILDQKTEETPSENQEEEKNLDDFSEDSLTNSLDANSNTNSNSNITPTAVGVGVSKDRVSSSPPSLLKERSDSTDTLVDEQTAVESVGQIEQSLNAPLVTNRAAILEDNRRRDINQNFHQPPTVEQQPPPVEFVIKSEPGSRYSSSGPGSRNRRDSLTSLQQQQQQQQQQQPIQSTATPEHSAGRRHSGTTPSRKKVYIEPPTFTREEEGEYRFVKSRLDDLDLDESAKFDTFRELDTFDVERKENERRSAPIPIPIPRKMPEKRVRYSDLDNEYREKEIAIYASSNGSATKSGGAVGGPEAAPPAGGVSGGGRGYGYAAKNNNEFSSTDESDKENRRKAGLDYQRGNNPQQQQQHYDPADEGNLHHGYAPQQNMSRVPAHSHYNQQQQQPMPTPPHPRQPSPPPSQQQQQQQKPKVRGLSLPTGPTYDPVDEDDLVKERDYQQGLKSRIDSGDRQAERTLIPPLQLQQQQGQGQGQDPYPQQHQLPHYAHNNPNNRQSFAQDSLDYDTADDTARHSYYNNDDNEGNNSFHPRDSIDMYGNRHQPQHNQQPPYQQQQQQQQQQYHQVPPYHNPQQPHPSRGQPIPPDHARYEDLRDEEDRSGDDYTSDYEYVRGHQRSNAPQVQPRFFDPNQQPQQQHQQQQQQQQQQPQQIYNPNAGQIQYGGVDLNTDRSDMSHGGYNQGGQPNRKFPPSQGFAMRIASNDDNEDDADDDGFNGGGHERYHGRRNRNFYSRRDNDENMEAAHPSPPKYDYIEHNKGDYGKTPQKSYKRLHEISKEERDKLDTVFIQPKPKPKGGGATGGILKKRAGSQNSLNSDQVRQQQQQQQQQQAPFQPYEQPYMMPPQDPGEMTGESEQMTTAEQVWARRSSTLASRLDAKGGKKKKGQQPSLQKYNSDSSINQFFDAMIRLSLGDNILDKEDAISRSDSAYPGIQDRDFFMHTANVPTSAISDHNFVRIVNVNENPNKSDFDENHQNRPGDRVLAPVDDDVNDDISTRDVLASGSGNADVTSSNNLDAIVEDEENSTRDVIVNDSGNIMSSNNRDVTVKDGLGASGVCDDPDVTTANNSATAAHNLMLRNNGNRSGGGRCGDETDDVYDDVIDTGATLRRFDAINSWILHGGDGVTTELFEVSGQQNYQQLRQAHNQYHHLPQQQQPQPRHQQQQQYQAPPQYYPQQQQQQQLHQAQHAAHHQRPPPIPQQQQQHRHPSSPQHLPPNQQQYQQQGPPPSSQQQQNQKAPPRDGRAFLTEMPTPVNEHNQNNQASLPVSPRQEFQISQPITQQIVTEDGQRISVDVNLKLISPPPSTQQQYHHLHQPHQQQQQQQHDPYDSRGALGRQYPAAPTHYADDIEDEILGGVAVGGSGYSKLFGDGYSYATPRDRYSADDALRALNNSRTAVNPYGKIPPILEPYEGRDNVPNSAPAIDEGGSYMDAYVRQKRQDEKPWYKVYNLKDFRRMKKEVHLGTLGPDLDSDILRERKEKAQRQSEYAKNVMSKNKTTLLGQKPPTFPRPRDQDDILNKRKVAVEYAKSVPKPTVKARPTQYNNYELASEKSPIAKVHNNSKKTSGSKAGSKDASLTSSPTHNQAGRGGGGGGVVDKDIEQLDLARMRQRYEEDKQNEAVIRRNNGSEAGGRGYYGD